MTMENISRGTGTALWRQIAERLEGEIRSGRYRPGERLPTEHRLAQDFGVNRHTVRRAVAALAERGLARVEQGRGTFIQEAMIDYPLRKRTRFSENLLSHRREPSGNILSVREEPAGETVAKALEIRKGTTVVVIERVGVADGRPVNASSHYFPKARFPALAAAFAETGSISAAMQRLGVGDYTRKITRVTAHPARAADVRLLQQASSRPVLMTEGINVDATGRPIEYGVARWAADRVQLVIEPGD